MDTHIATHPDIEPSTAGMSARLPDEANDVQPTIGELEAGERVPSSAAKPTHRRRRKLLAGVALAAVAIAGGAFLVSPYNKVYPVPHLQASVNNGANNAARFAKTTLRPILAPSASLAKVAVPPTPPATRDAYTPKPRDQEVAELRLLHPGSTGRAAVGSSADGHTAKAPVDHTASKPDPAVAPVPSGSDAPSSYVPREPGSFSAPQTAAATASPPATPVTAPVSPAGAAPKDATALIVASLPKTQPAIPDTQAAPHAAPAPVLVAPRQAAEPAPASASPAARQAPARQPDALAVATSLRASPMTPPEQVQVLNLVTEMAAMVKDLRKQQTQLRADLGKSSADVTARLTDYERRLALAEARSAVTAADDATETAPGKSVEPVSEPAAATLKPIPVLATRPVAVVPAPAPPGVPKVYRVQAASPGLALLAQVDRGGGDGAQLQVVVGDTVPDYGRVKSIAQKGTAWVVTTEHGAIQ
jgi:hypothetical protein